MRRQAETEEERAGEEEGEGCGARDGITSVSLPYERESRALSLHGRLGVYSH